MTPSKVQVKRLLRKLSRSWRRPLNGPATELLARARQYFWFHSVDLGNGVVTPGGKSLNVLHAEAEAIFGPLDLRGMEALLKLVGLGRIVYQPHPIDKGARGIFHAYKNS